MTQRARGWRKWHRRNLDQATVDELADLFRKGATVKIAASAIEVPPGVLRMWLAEGERQLTEIYAEGEGYPEHEGMLYVACAKAMAEYLQTRVDRITDPGDGDWRPQSWLLERRDDEFNVAAKVDVHTTGTVEVVQHDQAIIAAELRQLLASGQNIPILAALPNPEAADGADPPEPPLAA